ncbi:cysteine desulfurase CsdA [Vibrio sp. 404]|uniref:Probable cysteine desulfurase n=1 Tax=Vibrio marinisediminis TaxID=2758441 RepID=A0A7W2FS92_9VIBR|nr:cysteine desulfurase CsdA [Vibrio marinisediminis]MBA5763305.1 cysteine desulfurase CsdA [Vibrio marinisediminis]
MLDITAIRSQFPALNQQVNDQSLVYLDSAATTQKPQTVIDAISQYYSSQNANVHRGSHSLTAQATSQFESARSCVTHFINAASEKEIIWTRGATEALNLIAQTYARNTLQVGDEILVGEMEHHANIVPWQIVAQQTGAKVVKAPMTPDCQLDLAAFEQCLNHNTKIVALAHTTNVTGTRQPIEAMIELAHQYGAVVVIDAAQGIVHEQINVQSLNADFLVFSGHKIFAPAGIGVLYGKLALLEAMPPWHGGGKMVEKVSFSGTTYSQLPGKFEAGTPNVAGAIALAKAIEWYSQFEREQVEKHIHHLVEQTYLALCQHDDVTVIGYQPNASVISFTVDGVHHQDVATLLDQQGVAVRSGHHCAHPLMDALGITGTIRLSFALYNDQHDVDRLLASIDKSLDML